MVTVLIVDDDPSAQRLVMRILTKHFDVACLDAPNGAVALDLLLSRPVDLVVLDLEMPVLDGIKTLEVMRQTPTLRALPVVLVTGRPDEDRVRMALQLGLTTVLVKPFSEEALSARVRPILAAAARQRGSERRQARRLALRPQQTVLVVEHDQATRELLAATLHGTVHVTTAENEFVAMSTYASLAPDVVWLGSTSGVWSRTQLQNAIRELPRAKPVSFVGSLPREELAAAAASGAYDAVARRTRDASELETDLVRILEASTAVHVVLRPGGPPVGAILGSLAEIGLAIRPSAAAAPLEVPRTAVASGVLNVADVSVILNLRTSPAGAVELAGQDARRSPDVISEDHALAVLRNSMEAWVSMAATSLAMAGFAAQREHITAIWSQQPPPISGRDHATWRQFATGRGQPLLAIVRLGRSATT
jgi:CheY-like chemotaxis protein